MKPKTSWQWIQTALLVASLSALTGCGVGTPSTTSAPNPNAGFTARFYPAGGIGPFPTDLDFLNSTTGTLNIPVTDPGNFEDPYVDMNTMAGFSTTAPINAYFSQPVNAASLPGHVYLFQVQTDPQEGYAVTGFVKPLTLGTDYTATVSPQDPDVIDITPILPLAPSSSYLLVLTKGIQDTDGAPVSADTDYAAIEQHITQNTPLTNPTLEAISPIIGSQIDVASAVAGIPPSSIVLTWTVSTQSITPVLDYIEQHAQPTQVTDLKLMGTTADFIPGSPGYANVYQGLLTIPYYLGAPTAADPAAPLTDFWHGVGGSYLTRYNPAPVPTTTLEIPILVTVPNSNSPNYSYPSTGFPVAIFQHGIGQNRTNDLAVADAFADADFATVAIDLPLHGITDPQNPFYMGSYERTFNLPVGLGTPEVQPGTIAPSGTYFINLSQLLVSRDNLREAVADLITLTKTLPDILIPSTGQKLDSSELFFVGHSLGAIVGTVYLGVDPQPYAATLGMPGAEVPYLLNNSATFGPIIQSGLEQAGIQPNTQLYDDFLRNAQTVVDSGDPANWGAQAARLHPIDMIEVIGDSQTGSLPDQVVPNSATNLLAKIMGLTQYGTPNDGSLSVNIVATGVRGIVKFLTGAHGSLIDPSPSLAAFEEMQSEMVVFAAGYPSLHLPGGGETLLVQNTAIVQNPQ
jgi:pimeloyl-ACP methyl ester carboxylesterase